MKWNNAAETLPKIGKEVMMVIYGADIVIPYPGEDVKAAALRQNRSIRRVTLGFLDEDGMWYCMDGYPTMIHPTWWAELPEAPLYDKYDTRKRKTHRAHQKNKTYTVQKKSDISVVRLEKVK